MGYTRADCERLVRLADKDGRITYAQIQKEFPEFSNSSIYDWIGDSFHRKSTWDFDHRALRENGWSNVMLFWDTCPDDYVEGYQFKPTDTFYLSVSGFDLRHQLKKEAYQNRLNWIAAIGGAVGGIGAIATLLSLLAH